MKKAFFALLCLLAGCGSKNSSSSSGANGSIQGTWNTACLSTTSGYYAIIILGVNGQSFTDTVTYYQDSACSEALIVFTGIATFTLSGTNAIDYSYSSITALIPSESVLTTANTQQFYGYNNWTVNTALNVSGRSIIPAVAAGPSTGTTFLSIYEVSGNEMMLGDPSTTERPTSVDSSVVYHQ